MVLEVHSSLSSFGEHEGGAETVINTLKEIVTEEGSIFMPALRLSRELPLTSNGTCCRYIPQTPGYLYRTGCDKHLGLGQARERGLDRRP